MEVSKLALVGLTMGILSACGGSSDENSTAAIVETITGRIISETTCGNQSYAGVEVLVHDSAGKIVKRVKNADDGEFSVPWNKDDAHISFIKNGVKLHAKTLLNVSVGDLGLISLDSDTTASCNCTNVSFDTSEITALYPNTQLLPSASNVQVCKVDGKYLPINLALVSEQDGVAPIAARIDINGMINGQSISLKAEHFSGNEQLGKLVSINGLEAGDSLSTGTFSARKSGMAQEFTWPQSAYAFPLLFPDEYLSASNNQSLSLPNSAYVFFFSAHTQPLSVENESYDVELKHDFQPLLQALQPVLEGVAANQATHYDFSQYGSHISAVNFLLGTQAWDWSIEGAKSGTLPLLELPTDAANTINLSTSLTSSVSLILVESKRSASYTAFRQEWAKVSRDTYFLPDTKISFLSISGKI